MSDLLSDAQRRLVPVDGYEFVTFASRGKSAEAALLSARAGRAWQWLSEFCDPMFAMPPLFVLTADDWTAFAPMPVYGMPQAWSDRLVAPATGSDLFDDYVRTLLPLLSQAQLQELSSVYGSPSEIGRPVADLAVTHEVGHYFHRFDDATGATDFARPWVAELFANVAMYGYVAECEPAELRSIESICVATAAARPAAWDGHGIDSLGGGTPSGYIWAQFLLILIARQIWQAAGPGAFSFFRSRLRDPSLGDDDIVDILREMDGRVADSVEQWPSVVS